MLTGMLMTGFVVQGHIYRIKSRNNTRPVCYMYSLDAMLNLTFQLIKHASDLSLTQA